jgi:hypothetical protein
MPPISPGVYTKIIDLSEYVQNVPSTIGFLPIICERGPDNRLVLTNARDFYLDFGEPNINYLGSLGKQFGLGPYVASSFLKQSDSLYTIRVTPNDAAYANLFLAIDTTVAFDNKKINLTDYSDKLSSIPDVVNIKSDVTGDSTVDVLTNIDVTVDNTVYKNCNVEVSYSINSAANTIDVDNTMNVYNDDNSRVDVTNFTLNSNTNKEDIVHIVRTIYEDICDKYNLTPFAIKPCVSMNTAKELDSAMTLNALKDSTGGMFTVVDEANGKYTGLITIFGVGRGAWYNNFRIKLSPHTIPMKALENVYILEIEQKQSASDYDSVTKSWVDTYEVVQSFEVSFNPNKVDESGDSMFIVDVLNNYFRYLKADVKGEGEQEAGIKELLYLLDELIRSIKTKLSESYINIYNDTAVAASYTIDLSDIVDVWANTFPGSIQLGGGDDGTLTIDTLTELLGKAYLGQLRKAHKETGDPAWTNPAYVDEVLDTDNYYFNLVFDAGYPSSVKTQIVSLCKDIRKDCLAILDNSDTRTTSDALDKRINVHTFNTFYAALYECYTKIYDIYTGKDIWLTPVYHMASIIPYTENVAELWYAPAGFNRATIDGIKSMRFSPRQGERDQFYLNQINPIVKFNVGFTVWGQLTTQRRPTALQDINIVRLVLYIKRALEQFCKFYIFELNDQETWNAVKNNIEMFLEEIKRKRGLYDYSVDVGATEYEIKKKEMHVNVTLVPTRVVEKICLNFFIK